MTMYEDILVSVVMPVYNTKEEYLRVAIKSILTQTHENIEFIIVNDCSNELCLNVLKEYVAKDDRIRLISNLENLGITKSLNIGLEACKGKYIARMDADDVSLRYRLERQITYLEQHAEVDVLACGANVYSEDVAFYTKNVFGIDANRLKNQFPGIYRQFDSERERIHLSFANIEFTHPTAMFRKSFLDENGIVYNEEIPKAQDYAMWVRCAEVGMLDSLQEILFISRENSDMSGVIASGTQRLCADQTKIVCLKRLLDDPSDREALLYTHMRDVELYGNASENVRLVKTICDANSERRVYDHLKYREELFFWWFRKCLYEGNRQIGIRILLTPYMFINILRILPVMMAKYISDIKYAKSITTLWMSQLRSVFD